MPRGEEEDIALRAGGDFRFVALLANRIVLERLIEPAFDPQPGEARGEYLPSRFESWRLC